MEYLLIIISAILVSNIVLTQFLGICPFLGVSGKISTALGMGAAVTFVMAIATTVTFLTYDYVLKPLGLDYLQTIAYILIIAALVQMVEIMLKKVSPHLSGAWVFLPFDYSNCAISGCPAGIQKDLTGAECGVRRAMLWFCTGAGDLCRYPRTVGTCRCTCRNAWCPSGHGHSGDSGDGFYGFFGYCLMA
jgi:Na+-transporting NADH:ubiquinone oxidoreductase subunit NqrE